MKLLVSFHPFQKDVLLARERLGIPKGGLNPKGEDIKNWHEESVKKTDEVMASPDFKEQERTIIEKQNRGEISRRIAQKQMELFYYSKVPFNFLSDFCSFLTRKYQLPKNFEENVKRYILTDEVSAPTQNFKIVVHDPKHPIAAMRHVPIEIYARLTDDDLAEIKRCVDGWVGTRLPKFQALKNVDKALTMEQWLVNRERYDAVEDAKYEISLDEIAEERLGDRNRKKELYENKRQLKTLRERRFGKA